ncbi:MAG: MBL fold metallo-hydrolase [Dehalococcoidia bacterium]|nr:MBL fold metallo-hydrolase [Dehalococcoidia bacterium]
MDFKELSPGVYAALVSDGTANAGFIAGDGEVLVVDTLMLPTSQGQELVAAVSRLAPAVPRLVLNTHFHGDHTFGNMLFPESVIMAHNGVRRRMEEMGDKMVERSIRFRPEHEAEFRTVKIALPTLGFSHGMTLDIGRRRVEMFHPGPAHTDGDTLVFLPDDGMLFAGDLLFTGTFPAVLPETDTRGWVKVLKELETMSANRVVPGHGPMSTVEDMKTLRDYLQHVQGEVRRCLDKGMSKEETSKAVSTGPGEGWDKPERHAMGVGQVYEELSRPV